MRTSLNFFSICKKATQFITFLLLVLFSNNALAQTTQTFAGGTTSSNTYTWVCPQGVTSVSVQAWGGGGGGGFGMTTGYASGGGGGGGAFASNTTITVVPGTSYTIVAAGGGTAGTTGGVPAGAGKNSTFAATLTPTTFLVAAVGGGGGGGSTTTTGGIAGIGGLASACTPSTVTATTFAYTGGNGAPGATVSGTTSPTGAGGSSGGTGANGCTPTSNVACTAPTGAGAGAAGVTASSTAGVTATANGGGGSGGKANSTGLTAKAGGAGAPGKVTLTYTCPSAAMNLPIIEGFNFYSVAPACWTQQTVIGTNAITFVTSSSNPTTTPFEGSYYVFWNSYSSTYAAGNSTRLVSPKYTTSTATTATVTFNWMNENNTTYSTGAYLTEGMTVQYSLDGTNWTDIQFFPRHDGTMTAGTSAWTAKSVALPAGALGQSTVYFGFKFVSAYGDNCAMDNLKIQLNCAAPADQPTSLNFTNAGTSQVTVNYTAAASLPSGYLVVRYPQGSIPTNPSDATVYTAGTAIGINGTVVYAGAGVTTTATGLTPQTNYDFYVYDYNNTNCLNGPVYNTTSPLTSTATTANCPSSFTSTISIDPSATATAGSVYNTLTAALLDLNGCGITQPTVLELKSGYPSVGETFPIVLGAVTGMSITNTITIRPASGVSINLTNACSTGGIFNIDGGSYWKIDGRDGGTGSNKNFTIENTSVTAGSPGIFLRNGAQYNTITYCNIKSANTSTSSSGTVAFSTSTALVGNSYNTVSYCNVSDASTGSSAACITSSPTGTSVTDARFNSFNTITNNNIFNFYSAISTSYFGAGVLLTNVYNSDWTITNNSFYQTATRSVGATGADMYGIYINGTAGGNFTISNNYIGGTSASCGGTPLTVSTTATNTFRGMYLSIGSSSPSTISNNTITNISFSSATSSSTPAGISMLNGAATISGNTIGATTGTGAISFSTSASGAYFAGILLGTGTTDHGGLITVQNNNIGSITVGGAGTIVFSGIRFESAQSASLPDLSTTKYVISGNTIGSTTTANSISNGTNAGTYGIYKLSTNTTLVDEITNNTVANITVSNATATSNAVYGIFTAATASKSSITTNTVYNLSSNYVTALTFSGIGIYSPTTAGGNLISGNTIYSISNTTSTNASVVAGVLLSGSTATSSTIEKNTIYGLSLSTSSTSGSIYGVYATGYPLVTKNNVIRLGLKSDGTDITTGYTIFGIYESITAGATSHYSNSINIAASTVSGVTSNTYAFYSTGLTNTRVIKNNVFSNVRSGGTTGVHYGIRLAAVTSASGLTIDNNIYYNGVSGSTALFTCLNSATSITSLSDWQTATAQDVFSYNANPNFTSNNNLAPASYGFPGLPAGSVSVDILGTTRNTSYPTIGAYEAASWYGAWKATPGDNVYGTNANWVGEAGPSALVIIPSGASPMPTLSSATTTINRLFIGGTLAIGASNTLTINGAVSGDGTITGSNSSNLVIGGAAGTINLTSGSRILKDLN